MGVVGFDDGAGVGLLVGLLGIDVGTLVLQKKKGKESSHREDGVRWDRWQYN